MNDAIRLLLFVAAFRVQSTDAVIRLPKFVTDGLVLQTNAQSGVRSFLSGWADPNETVTVNAPRGPYTAIAGLDGSWSLQLDPIEASPSSPPSTITVTGSTNASNVITVKNVRFGEVFLCAGGAEMSETSTAPLPPVPSTVRFYVVGEDWRNSSTSGRPDVPTNSTGWFRGGTDDAKIASLPRLCVLSVLQLLDTYPRIQGRPVGVIISTASVDEPLDAWIPPNVGQTECTSPTTTASGRFNAMIAPFTMTSFRAVFWALGSSLKPLPASNTSCLLRALINGWRDATPVGDWAFVFAQTSAVGTSLRSLTSLGTALAQFNALPAPSRVLVGNESGSSVYIDNLDVDTTGMVPTVDLGFATGVKRISTIASRLALAVTHVAYAEQPPSAYGGPVLKSATWVSGSGRFETTSRSLRLTFGEKSALRLMPFFGCTRCCTGANAVGVRLCPSAEPSEFARCSNATAVELSEDKLALQVTADAPTANVVVLMANLFEECGVAFENGSIPAGISAVKIQSDSSLSKKRQPRFPVSNDSSRFSTPALGFNAWNAFHCDVSERLIVAMADSMVASGLAAAGYRYISLDDCWMVERGVDGSITPDPVRFPSGIKALADYVHNRGLLFGIYEAPASTTPQGRPGLLGHEAQDIATYCEWGVDYVKLDSKGSTKDGWQLVRNAINRCPRPMWLQVAFCKTVASCAGWMDTLANSWRTSGDGQATWASVLGNLDATEPLWPLSGPTGPIGGHWNDADMLEVGNVGLTPLEMKTQISLWSFINSPLLTSFDLRKLLTPEMESIRTMLTTPGLLSLNQDRLGYAGRRINNTLRVVDSHQMMVAQCSGGDDQDFLFNATTGTFIQVSSGLAVAIDGCTVPDTPGRGQPIILQPLDTGGPCNGRNQQWIVETNMTIRSRLSGLVCMDVYGHVNPVQAHFCVANPSGEPGPPESQTWMVHPSATTQGHVTIRWGSSFQECLQEPSHPSPPPPTPNADVEVLEKQLANGDVGLLLLNRQDTMPLNVTVDLTVVPGIDISKPVHVTNVWTNATEGFVSKFLWRMVAPHDAAVLRLSQP